MDCKIMGNYINKTQYFEDIQEDSIIPFEGHEHMGFNTKHGIYLQRIRNSNKSSSSKKNLYQIVFDIDSIKQQFNKTSNLIEIIFLPQNTLFFVKLRFIKNRNYFLYAEVLHIKNNNESIFFDATELFRVPEKMIPDSFYISESK